MRGANKSWLTEFLTLGGVPALFEFIDLSTVNRTALLRVGGALSPSSGARERRLLALVGCVTALINQEVTLRSVLKGASHVATIALCLDLASSSILASQANREVLTALSVICFFSKRGRELVLQRPHGARAQGSV